MYFRNFTDIKKHYNTDSSSGSESNILSSDSQSDHVILNTETIMNDHTNMLENLVEGRIILAQTGKVEGHLSLVIVAIFPSARVYHFYRYLTAKIFQLRNSQPIIKEFLN